MVIKNKNMKYIKLFEDFKLDENFYIWFNGSKIVDEDGKPLVVYHATPYDFTDFDINHSGKNHGNTFGKGFYFSPLEEYAKYFSKDVNAGDEGRKTANGNNIIKAYLSIKNPLIVNSQREYNDTISKEVNRKSIKDGRYNRYEAEKIFSKSNEKILMEMGYDGIIVKLSNKIYEIVCFSTNQIKIIR